MCLWLDSLVLVGGRSEVGDPAGDLLVDAEGAGRLPERRGSFGDGGGPMVATFAIVNDGSVKGEEVAFKFPEGPLSNCGWLVRPQL